MRNRHPQTLDVAGRERRAHEAFELNGRHLGRDQHGVDTGLRLQMPGQGEVGPAGGPAGDLYLEIKVRHHETFSRNGDDLLATVEVPMTSAILGKRDCDAALFAPKD